MTVDTSGKWWKGTEISDIDEYLAALEPEGYPVTETRHAQCSCGNRTFRLMLDRDEELGQTTCGACGKVTFTGDSGEFWSEASPEPLGCECGSTLYEVGLGLSIRENTWVRWLSIGLRCARCGILSSPLDWKSDADLTNEAALRIGG
jgi:hypothetical protein